MISNSGDVTTTIVNGNILMENKNLSIDERDLKEALVFAKERAPIVWSHVHDLHD